MNLNILTIPSDFTHVYMNVFKAEGCSDDLLQRIWDGQLEKIADRNAMMSTSSLLRIVERGYRFANIPHVGLMMGNQLTLTSHGMAGVAAMTRRFISTRSGLPAAPVTMCFPRCIWRLWKVSGMFVWF